MFDKEIAKEKIKEIVERFSQASKNKDYINGQSEENIKTHYIEPLFEALGWTRWDMQKEERVLRGRADYIFKIGNEESLVVEAKKTNVSLTEDEGRQAVSYAYHRKIKFAIVTNFKEVKVYHALSNIKNIDKNLLKFDKGGVFRLSYTEFLDNFDALFLLSKKSFEDKEIDKLLSKKDERLSRPIDQSILDDLLHIRDLLSKDLKKLRAYLEYAKIDEAVQLLIDRLIFMRSVEDRGMENANFLLGMVKDYREGRLREQLWYVLLKEFKRFDKEYDSKLFSEGILEDEKNIVFDNDVLQKIIRALYFGIKDEQARYMFDEIPGDLLGNIYEQYLGTILSGTDKRVKLEAGTGKRKKMGIYYTPSYIVDYIVKNTVREYIKDKTIDEILEVKILDPACGSGSFLIHAFQEVCDVVEEKLKKGEFSKKSQSFGYYLGRVSLAQKATILTNCIYGVDLDEKAVELAQLNLVLKVLEHEGRDIPNKRLPNLLGNIKNGNSLIDDPRVAGDKAFKWEAQFPEVFRQGGFDVVVGNPPYVNIFNIKDPDRSFFQKHYETATNKSDLYAFFVEKIIKELLRKNGHLGFIISNTWTSIQSFKNLRKIILENTKVENLVPLEMGTFADATVVPIVITFEKTADKEILEENKIKFSILEGKEFEMIKKVPQEYFMKDKDFVISLSINPSGQAIFEKLGKCSETLGDIAEFSLGIKTANNSKFVLTSGRDSSYKKVLKGKYIKRYYLEYHNEWIWYKPEEMMKRKGAGPRKPQYFEVPKKIILQEISGDRIIATLDEERYYSLDTTNILYEVREGINMKFILGLLNSDLINFWYGSQFKGIHVKLNELRKIPIKLPDKIQEKRIVSLVDEMLVLQKKLHEGNPTGHEKERLEQQIKNVDYEIDQEVYKLYGITKEEQKIIEESLK